ncbi:bifunctional nicotinamidase/pyrazinamidase [Methylobacterium gossipiicola]|uniref:Nicotinamidase n=1 Tax=Methylobacterium gossipiicola TaxID=582675 RepID=A0A1I2SCQ1_9HYPH|nr:bifunctional nicotinamidase/pyrazinamidase [Methylobacterium gossipiicola]SFG50480.1 nicotinamidase/pyrazinamidase [Methylobacterium gossipiicola]
MRPGAGDVLLVVDVQNDFLPGGALAVPDGDAVIAPINRLAEGFAHVVLTQDWHPPGHVSFATSHPGRAPFEAVARPYGSQMLWPDHCVQGTEGAALAPGLRATHAELVIRKGHRRDVDSYSAFVEADRTPTGLAGYLRERGFTRVVVCGLATDYCVAWTALDARAAGFSVAVVADAVRGIDQDGSVARAWAEMVAAGVERIATGDIAA